MVRETIGFASPWARLPGRSSASALSSRLNGKSHWTWRPPLFLSPRFRFGRSDRLTLLLSASLTKSSSNQMSSTNHSLGKWCISSIFRPDFTFILKGAQLESKMFQVRKWCCPGRSSSGNRPHVPRRQFDAYSFISSPCRGSESSSVLPLCTRGSCTYRFHQWTRLCQCPQNAR